MANNYYGWPELRKESGKKGAGERKWCRLVVWRFDSVGGWVSLGHAVIAVGRVIGGAVIRMGIAGFPKWVWVSGLGSAGLVAQKVPVALPVVGLLGQHLLTASHLDVAHGGPARLRMQDEIRAQLLHTADIVVLHHNDGRGPKSLGRIEPDVRLQGMAVPLAATPNSRLEAGPVEQLPQGDPLR